ncbi:MAG: Kdo domain containing protein [Flavobacteriaceae bacterium]|nr:Kdo domain containing protein [Flavobacteriaceae bacterium]
MNSLHHKKYIKAAFFFDDIIKNYDIKGEDYGNQDRNSLKLFDFKGVTINVKSFKVPNVINQIAYRFFRSSKAQRSFEYANKLTALGIGTPQPIAYYEFKTRLLFKKSFYISEHLNYNLTYRELTTDFNFPNHEDILRAFTRFTFQLHEKGINFLDHSPGNTLITKTEFGYDFALVDLNRMKFQEMSFLDRMQNFSRLTTSMEMVEIMSDEYAKLSEFDYNQIFSEMWKLTKLFQEKFHRKQRLKKQLKFWKKS